MSCVWDLDLNPEAKLVALALADQTVDCEAVSISSEIIARKVCMPIKRLNEIVRELHGYGLISDQSENHMRLRYNFTPLAETVSKMKRGGAV